MLTSRIGVRVTTLTPNLALFDPIFVYIAEDGTQNGNMMAAEVTYSSNIQFGSLAHANIRSGNTAPHSNVIMHVLGNFPDGLDEFTVSQSQAEIETWQ
jgi:hypothetical protein